MNSSNIKDAGRPESPATLMDEYGGYFDGTIGGLENAVELLESRLLYFLEPSPPASDSKDPQGSTPSMGVSPFCQQFGTFQNRIWGAALRIRSMCDLLPTRHK